MCMCAGAGMIFSQGLMRMRSFEDIEHAVRTMNWAHQGAGGRPPHAAAAAAAAAADADADAYKVCLAG